MGSRLAVAVAVVAGLGFAVPGAQAQDTSPATVVRTPSGEVLADRRGMTLYTYTRDMIGHSNCNDQCATAWPPLMAAAKANGDWSIVVRDDGKTQWAYKGRALYARSTDAKPGDITGEGIDNGKWRPAAP